MVDEKLSFDKELLLSQAIGNAQGTVLALVAYSKEEDFDIKKFSYFTGSKFAPGWEVAKNWTLEEVAKQLAINYASLGADDITLSSGEDEIELTIKDWPSQEYLDAFEIERSDVYVMFKSTEAIADFLGLKFTYETIEHGVLLTIKK